MALPIDITFHGLDKSEALYESIRKHAEKLARFAPSLMHCHVVVEPSERHHHRGNRYRIHVHLKVPGRDIQAGREPPGGDRTHEDPFVVVRDTFDAARRQLEDYERTRRGAVKTHAPAAEGNVAEIYKEADYGVIRTSEGREIHFHRHSLADGDFDRLEAGAQVRFHEVPGEQGPWASTVHVLGKHHSAG